LKLSERGGPSTNKRKKTGWIFRRDKPREVKKREMKKGAGKKRAKGRKGIYSTNAMEKGPENGREGEWVGEAGAIRLGGAKRYSLLEIGTPGYTPSSKGIHLEKGISSIKYPSF